MKILFTRFPFESEFGGLERGIMDLMHGLVSRSHDVGIMTNCPVFLDEKYKIEGVKYYKIYFPRPPVSKLSIVTFFLLLPFSLLYSLFLSFWVKRLRYTHVVMVSFGEKIVLTPFLLLFGIKVCFSEQERVRRWLTANPFFPIYKYLSKKVTVVALSKVFQEDLAKIGVESVVVNDGIDTDFWDYKSTNVTNNLPMNIRMVRLVTVARLRPEKGIYELLNVLNSIHHKGNSTGYKLTVVGDGLERFRLEKYVKENNLNVEFVGARNQTEIINIYHDSDLAIFPSIERETFGLTVLEAMSCGLPCVVSDEFASVDGVNIQGLWKYKATDLGQFESQLMDALKNIKSLDERIESELRNFVISNFGIAKMVDGYIDVLSKDS